MKRPRGLDQHAVAHRDNGGNTTLQQATSDGGFWVILGLCRLAGFQKEQSDATVPQLRAEAVGGNDFSVAIAELACVVRCSKTSAPSPFALSKTLWPSKWTM